MKQLNNEVIICPFLLPQYDILLKDWSELLSLLLKKETTNTKFHRHFGDLFHWQLWKVDVNYSLTFPSFSRPFFYESPLSFSISPRSAIAKYIPCLGVLLCVPRRDRFMSSSFMSTRRSTLTSQSSETSNNIHRAGKARLSSVSDSESVRKNL